MSNEQVEQVRDAHRVFLERQLNTGKINQRDYDAELRELDRWVRRNLNY
jgi:hypothetical protein